MSVSRTVIGHLARLGGPSLTAHKKNLLNIHYKENKQFCYYSRGSLYETNTWLKKAHNRGLIVDNDFQSLEKDIEIIAYKLNNYIKSIGTTK